MSASSSSHSAQPNIGDRNIMPKDLRRDLIVGNEQAHARTEIHIGLHSEFLECVDVDGNTPLMVAAEHGNAQGVTYLIGQGANKDAVNHARQTALTLAQKSLAMARVPEKSEKLLAILQLLS